MSKTDHPVDEIRATLQNWAEAARIFDIPALLDHYTDDIRAFDAVIQTQFVGKKAYGDHWQACSQYCTGPMVFEINDLKIEASDNVGFCHCLLRCGGTDVNGVEKTSWMRATSCLLKEGGRWRIGHEHFSLPFDMESGKALFDLEP
ncbi:MAG: nuclear transport factor 2 family protein [Pseudomonadota bacterium]